jgi:DNA-binding PadR family transcriptional regulator
MTDALLDRRLATLLPLTPVFLQILLALADRNRHGLGIADQVAAATGGRLKPGPGTLYGAIKRLLELNLVIDTSETPTDDRVDPRRRYYQLTALGRRALELETAQLATTLDLARAKGVM